ncbi:IucA/IucC family protein [Actinoplanes sp. NPDC049265]|uniref:IucA/IucC family protein n=1 Tax=Actinoplanes sp. NPDC049265 TaxID=3363902 RepID=UPI0037108EC4
MDGVHQPPADTLDAAHTRAELANLRPDLLKHFDAALPSANAAVLARLLGALRREPLPDLTDRGPHPAEGLFRATFTHHRIVIFPTSAAPTHLDATISAEGRDDRTITEPGALARYLWPHAALAAELDNSVANLALAQAAAAETQQTGDELQTAEGDPDGLGRLEQLVLDGHPLHPCCRTREGLTPQDVLTYAPEHRVRVRLSKLAVPPERWRGDGPPILLAHPWQARRLREEHPWLRDAGETEPMRPLMSLRTFAPTDGGPHVKTAVDVRMTSAVRTVSPAAVHNGPRLSTLLRKLTHDLPITVLTETHAGHVVIDGVPQRRLAHLIREAPRPQPGEAILPLGALGAGSTPLIVQAVRRAGAGPYTWLEDLARIWLPPLITVLDRGVALEAHGQNTLVGLRRGRPVRLLYRDFGGVRVSPARLGHDPGLRGDLVCDDPAELRAKLAAGALGTVAGQLVTLLQRHLDAKPARLWEIISDAIRRTGTRDGENLLTEPVPVKATTAMRLADDPLDDVWCHLDNPMAGAR